MLKINSSRAWGAGLFAVIVSLGLAAQTPAPKANPDQLRQDVEFLAAIQPPRNFDHVDSLNRAAAYIRSRLEQIGWTVAEQAYEVQGRVYKNLIVRLGPAQGERIVVGAHYDVCDDLPGADDNGSGVAGLLEIARLLWPMQASLNHPVELVFFTLEEPPNFGEATMGSAVHARSLAAAKIPVKLMISLEMIGYFGDGENTQDYPLDLLRWFYPTTGNFIGIVGRTREFFLAKHLGRLFAQGSTLPVQTIGAPRFLEGVDWSDHANYWDAGYPAVMVTDTAFARNHNYHKATDTPDTLDYARAAEVVNGVLSIIRRD